MKIKREAQTTNQSTNKQTNKPINPTTNKEVTHSKQQTNKPSTTNTAAVLPGRTLTDCGAPGVLLGVVPRVAQPEDVPVGVSHHTTPIHNSCQQGIVGPDHTSNTSRVGETLRMLVLLLSFSWCLPPASLLLCQPLAARKLLHLLAQRPRDM